MSIESETPPQADNKVKVNNIATARPLEFTGIGETVTDDPGANTIDVAISGVTKGIATLSSDGVNKVFTIAHGIAGPPTPTVAFIQASTSSALGSFVVTVDSTNITITYPFAPPSGSIVLQWIAY